MRSERKTDEWDKFIDEIVKHVAFEPDRENIRIEYREHMEDMAEALIADGLSDEDAVTAVLKDMGDPGQIGKELNKVHNAFLGYLTIALKVIMVLTILFFSPVLYREGFMPFIHSVQAVITGYPELNAEFVASEDYRITIDESFVMDDQTIIFDSVSHYKDGSLVLKYREKGRILSPSNCVTLDLTGCIHDEFGRSGNTVSTAWGAGYICYHQMLFTEPDPEAGKLIIDYGNPQTKYKQKTLYLEIDLEKDRIPVNPGTE